MDGVHIANWSKSKRFNASMFAIFVVAFVSSTASAMPMDVTEFDNIAPN